MTFLIDAQLPPALVRWLTQQGHVARHVEDLGLQRSDDIEIWNHALNTAAIIVTKDEDFAERTARSIGGPVILWFRIGNSTNRALILWLAPRWSDIIILLEQGNRLIEVR